MHALTLTQIPHTAHIQFCPNGGMRHLSQAFQQGVCPNLKELALETVGMRDRDLRKLMQVGFGWLMVLC